MKVEGVTEALREKVYDVWPDAAPTWFLELPQLLDYCKERWRLTYGEPFHDLSYHYVIPAKDDIGRDLVLKSGIPGESFTREVDVLNHINGSGMVKLLDYDCHLGLMLQERIRPGETIPYDDSAAGIFAKVMEKMWKPCEDTQKFISVEEWMIGFKNFEKYEKSVDNTAVIELVKRARKLGDWLLETMGENVLLHGDLHHENILTHQDGWIAIDPKGLIGEREYEPGPFLRNPFWDTSYHPEFERVVDHNVDVICKELGFDKRRVMQWTYVQSVLALIWVFEDHDRISTEMYDISMKMEGLLRNMK